jgi:hypothetical protein
MHRCQCRNCKNHSYRRNTDEQERLLKKQAAEGDIYAYERLAMMRIRREEWTTFVNWRLTAGTPLRNIELAWHLGHPGIRRWAADNEIQIRPLVADISREWATAPCAVLGSVIDNCFYALDIVWKLYQEELQKIVPVYLEHLNLLGDQDREYFVESEGPNQIPSPEGAVKILQQIEEFSEELHLVNYLGAEVPGTDLFVPALADYRWIDVAGDILEDSEMSKTQLATLSDLANALGCLYYHTEDRDVSTAFLHDDFGAYFEVLNDIAFPWLGASTGTDRVEIMTRIVNITALSLDYVGRAYTIMESGITDPSHSDYANSLIGQCRRLGGILAERLLYDVRQIPPELDALFALESG